MNNIVVASNRGPVQFIETDQGNLSTVRGGGGLSTALGAALPGQELTWIAAALSAGDSAAARKGGGMHRLAFATGDINVRLLDFTSDVFDHYYNEISNRYLWFVHLRLFDLVSHPQFDDIFYQAWNSYVEVNKSFASACDAQVALSGEVFIHDYHLSLVPAMLRSRRKDISIAHFTHCPWVDPGYFAILPKTIAKQLLDGLLGADLLGFLSPRWRRNFLRCCQDYGYAVDWTRNSVLVDAGREVIVRTYPLGVDAKRLRTEAYSPQVEQYCHEFSSRYSDRVLLTRVERMEPAKNLIRGLRATKLFFDRRPEAANRLSQFVLAFESREAVAEYRSYQSQVERIAEAINAESPNSLWLEARSNYPLALAAMRHTDILIANSLGDGMNLVVKEGMVLGERDPVLILSHETGAADEMGESALVVNPFDTAELADAIGTALDMPKDERAARARRLRALATALPPREWFLAQQRDLRAHTLDKANSLWNQ